MSEPAEKITIASCGPRIVRLRIGTAFNPSGAVQLSAAATTTHATVRPCPDPPGLDLCGLDGCTRLRLALPISRQRDRLHLRIEIIGEQHFYGLGQGGAPFDRLGQSRRLWNSHVNHGQGGDIAIPLLLSHVGVGLFFDTAAKAWVDAGDSYDQTWLDFSCDAAGLDVYFLAAPDLRGAMAEVARLLGRAPMPPRWVLGYIQSTRHFADAAEPAAVVQEFRQRNLPLDGIAFLSSYGAALGWNRGVGRLDFEPSILPDPASTFAALRADHVKVMLHEYPVLGAASPLHAEALARAALLDVAYPDARAGQPSANWHEGQRYLDFGAPEVGAWWWDQHRDLLDLGVDAWWLDGGEGPFPTDTSSPVAALHNRYDLMRQRAFAAGEARDRPDRRSFLLCRSGGPGMQAHSAACWSGDVNGTFATLALQIPTGLNVAMSGVPWWGTDIGGYYAKLPDTAELFVRWFQFGAFCPVFRAHGRDWRQHLPWAHGPAVEAICRIYLTLRYRLAPYNYTLAWQAHRQGLPLMRPMVLNHPDDVTMCDVGHQYLWGDHLLVAPVTQPGATTWPVMLPEGTWYDFWTQEMHAGGRAIMVAAPLDRLPLLVAAGAIIPLGPAVEHLDDPNSGPLTVLIYPGGHTEFTLYEDDGISRAYEHGRYTLTRFSCTVTDDAIICQAERACILQIHMPVPPRAVRHAAGGEVAGCWHEGAFLMIPLDQMPASVSIERNKGQGSALDPPEPAALDRIR